MQWWCNITAYYVIQWSSKHYAMAHLLALCCFSVADGGPTLIRNWLRALYLLDMLLTKGNLAANTWCRNSPLGYHLSGWTQRKITATSFILFRLLAPGELWFSLHIHRMCKQHDSQIIPSRLMSSHSEHTSELDHSGLSWELFRITKKNLFGFNA